MRKRLVHLKLGPEFIRRQKKMLRQALGLKNYFSKIKQPVMIDFGRWFLNEKYRAELIKELGLKINPKLRQKKIAGTGSSFEGRKGDATKMKILDRYKAFLSNKKYLSFFESDKELVKLTLELFGMDPLNLS
jgi:hypothetical protein